MQNQDSAANEIQINPNAILYAFPQSDFWAAFQKALGKTVHQLSGPGWHAVCTVTTVPTGFYWHVPYGPFAQDLKSLKEAVRQVNSAAKEAGALWVRFEPRLRFDAKDIGLKIVKAPRGLHPEHTTMLDLRVDKGTLYTRLGKTNRQRVNKQERDNSLVFWTSTTPEDVLHLSKMLVGVSKRTGAVFYDDDYLLTQAKVLMPLGHMRVEFTGTSSKKPLACTVIHDYQGVATYTYAASLPEARDLGAANLLIWNAMLNAKERGNDTFDFWGIAGPDDGPNHPWQGFSAFKKSFGTVDVSFAGTWDIPLSGQYYIYRGRSKVLSKLRSTKQRLAKSRTK